MSDIFLDLAHNKTTKNLLAKLGFRLPQPLDRDLTNYNENMFSRSKIAIVGQGVLNQKICAFADRFSINLTCLDSNKSGVVNYEPLRYDDKLSALIFDACDLDLKYGLDLLYKFFNLYTTMLKKCGRVIIISNKKDPIFEEALSGFMKSLSKELGANGITVNKIILAKDISLDSINLDDILSHMFCKVSLSRLIFEKQYSESQLFSSPLRKKTCVVTGASRGIGLAICKIFAQQELLLVLICRLLGTTQEVNVRNRCKSLCS